MNISLIGLETNLKKAENEVKAAKEKADEQKQKANSLSVAKVSMWKLSKRIKELKEKLKVEREANAIIKADLKDLNESGLTGTAVKVERNEKEANIKRREEEIKQMESFVQQRPVNCTYRLEQLSREAENLLLM